MDIYRWMVEQEQDLLYLVEQAYGSNEMSEQVEKRCTGLCGRLLPATPEFFHRQKAGKYGVTSCCKECSHKRHNAYYQKNKQQLLTKHKEWREANPEYHKLYHQKNIDIHNIASREYNRKNAERLLIDKKRYYLDNRERIIAYEKAHQSKREVRKRINKRNRDRYSIHPEMKSRARISRATRQARKRAVLGNHTVQQIQELLRRQRYRCYYCSTRFEKVKGKYVYHVDHTFPLSRVTGTGIPANDISYLVLACPTCNLSKGDRFPWEWHKGGRLL